uniref:HSF-type DNA-binding domain-containing protein n=1 Tax=Parascaris univalens TaxID=6257 RepID=A0A915BG04_PARUN
IFIVFTGSSPSWETNRRSKLESTKRMEKPSGATQPDAAQRNNEQFVVGHLPREEEKMPLFLIKLWNIVEDTAYQNVIRWDESGYSFHILDPYSFCRNVLPQYFKHNNLNSLIRQLNMYGFRKMTPIERSGLARAESDQDHLEFSHPYFVRDHPELLVNIKRKSASHRPADQAAVSLATKDLSLVLDEIRQLREKQRAMETKMTHLVKENESVWQQLSHMRSMHVKQQQVVNKLVQFLVALAQPSAQKRLGKRSLLAIDEVGGKRSRMSSGQTTTSGTQPANVAEVLDRLQRELAEGTVGGAFPSLFSPRSSQGPIIADITDEPDANSLAASVSAVASTLTQNICSTQSQQAGSSSMGRVLSQTPPTEHQQQHSVEQLHNYSFSPTLTLSPSLDRQLSTELTEYLSSQEQSIDGCRDLIGGHWDLNLNLDSCLDDEPRQQQLMLQGVDPTLVMSEEPTTPDLLTPNVSPQRNIGSDE